MERAYGVFQSKWYITLRLVRFLSMDVMAGIVKFCTIIHNRSVKERMDAEGCPLPNQTEAIDLTI